MTLNDYFKKYNQWLNSEFIDPEIRAELAATTEDTEIKELFHKDLEFGTGGLRGVMGAGTNRVNKYTIRKATLGFANYILSTFGDVGKEKGVAIAFDSRLNSAEFALEAALVLAYNGIKAYIFDELQPTPILSYAVRRLGCIGGIVITASHNPKEYNGYKVYNQHGYQAVPDEADQIIKYSSEVDDIVTIPTLEEDVAREQGLLVTIDEAIIDDFLAAAHFQSLVDDDVAKSNLQIVFTPIHGTGNVPVRRILRQAGFENVSVVKTQELPDGNFPTVSAPNPEEADALDLAIKQAESEEAHLVIGTDPDCDRVGVAVKHQGKFQLLTGNQIGALLVEFVLSHLKQQGKLTEKATLIKTIVTNELGAKIAQNYGLVVMDTLTGFKYIGEKITEFEFSGSHEFIIGYEESHGYLIGTHARDKDAVVTSMLICEMAAYYRAQGKTLVDVLGDLYQEYGFYLDHMDSLVYTGMEGRIRIVEFMNSLKENGAKVLPDVIRMEDYSQGINDLPPESVLKFIFADGSWLAARPSGTEPKLKIYYSLRDSKEALAKIRLAQLRDLVVSNFVAET